MTTWSVPEYIANDLSILALASDEVAEKIYEKLAQIPVKVFQKDAVKAAIASVTELGGLGGGLSATLPDVLLSLYIRMINVHQDPRSFTQELISKLKLDFPDLFNDETCTKLSRVLAKLLAIEGIRASQTAASLLEDHERLFVDARVLTDIRPIFEPDAGVPPKSAVVIHNLKLAVYSTDHQEIYLALDNADLDSLIETLQRAKAKGEQLRVFLSKSGLQQIDL
jgi:hypothetical protein